jgi:hypothetical protein
MPALRTRPLAQEWFHLNSIYTIFDERLDIFDRYD